MNNQLKPLDFGSFLTLVVINYTLTSGYSYWEDGFSSQTTSTPNAFTFYSNDIPANLLGQDLYVRIGYNRRVLDINGETEHDRCIFDQLEITLL